MKYSNQSINQLKSKTAFFGKTFGFTLAELLISLAILGVIATFTIPKILTAQQNSSDKAKAKEAAGMITAAYDVYRYQNTVSASTRMMDLTPYMNYVSVDTSTNIDCGQDSNCTLNCGTAFGSSICLQLHNGGKLLVPTTHNFSGTTTTNAISAYFDPDGQVTESPPTTTGPGHNVQFVLYSNGRLNTWGTAIPGCGSWGCFSANPSADPYWFSWN